MSKTVDLPSVRRQAPPTAAATSTPAPSSPRRESWIRAVVRVLTTTDHKVIGNLYFVTTFVFFMLGGVLALVIRAELAYEFF